MRRLRVGLQGDQHRQREVIPPHGMPPQCGRFRIGSVGLSSTRRSALTVSVTLEIARPAEGASCVSPRSHPKWPASTPDVGSRRAPVPRSPAMRVPRLGPEAADSLVNPAPILALRRFGTINAAHASSPGRANATCKCRRRPALARRRPRRLDRSARTGVNYGFPMAVLARSRGAKGVAVVTCPSSPGLGPGSRRPRGGGPEVPFVVHVPWPCQRSPLGAP
jgi:hypothetical protein